MPRELDTTKLQRFSPKQRKPAEQANAKHVVSSEPEPAREAWPSREPLRDGQITIRASLDEIERFRRVCKDDRRTYGDMLRILLDLYENK